MTDPSPANDSSPPSGKRRRKGGRGRKRRLALAAVAVVGLLVAGALAGALLLRATPAERAEHFLELAHMRLAEGRPAEAVPLLEKSIEAGPDRIETRRALLSALVRAERDDEADAAARALLERVPDDGFAHRHLARSLWRAGDDEAALEHAEAALRDPGERGPALRLRAGFHLSRGRLSRALDDLTAAAEASPDDPRSAFLAARIASVLGHLAGDGELVRRARQGFEAAALSRGDSTEERVLRAAALLRSGAGASARSVLAEVPEAERPVDLVAEIETAQGAHGSAERVLRAALADAEGDAADRLRAGLVHALLAAGRVPEAAVEFDVLAGGDTSSPRSALLRRSLALAGHLRANPDDHLFRVVVDDPLALRPSDAPLVATLTEAAAEEAIPAVERRARIGWWGPVTLLSGDDATARSAPDRLRAELAALRRDDVADPHAALWTAVDALRSGNGPAARTASELAAAGAPGELAPALVHALALSAVARSGEALDVARRAARSHPADVRAALVRLLTLVRAGEHDAAARAARVARGVWPRDPSLAVLAGPLVDSGDREGSSSTRALARAHAALAEGDLRRAAEIAVPVLADAERSDDARALLVDAFETSSAAHAEREAQAPDDPRPSIRRAQSLLLAGRVERAEQVLRDATERQSDPASRFALARLLASLGRAEEGLAVLDAAADLDPAMLASERGRVLLSAGRLADARAAWRQALAAASGSVLAFDARRRTALTLLLHADEEDDDAEAVRAWVARKTATHEAGERAASLEVVRGHLALRAGDAATALATAERLLESESEVDDEPRTDAVLLAAVAEAALDRLPAAESRVVGLLVRRPFHRAARRLLARVRIARARQLHAEGDAAGATESLVHAVGLSDLDSAAVVALAGLANRPDGPDVEKLAATLERAHPLRSAAPLLRALHLRAAAPVGSRLPPLREAFRRDPGDATVQALLIEGLLEAERLDDAREVAAELCAQPDRGGRAHALLARVLEASGDAAGAREAYVVALERNPRDEGVRRRLAEHLLRAGEVEEARELLEVSLGRQSVVRPDELAQLLVRAGDGERAVHLLRSALAREPSPALHTALARELRTAGDLAGAARELDAAIRLEPGSPVPVLARLSVVRASGSADAFRERFTGVAAAEDRGAAERATAHLALGVLAQSDSDLDGAESAYRAAIEVAPARTASGVMAANNLAWLLGEMRGRPADGLPFARKAHAAAPDDPEILDTLGRLLDRAGNPAEALPYLDRAVAAAPDRVGPRLHRADALFSLSRFDEARRDYAQALRDHPEAARAHGAEDRLVELDRRKKESPR